MSDMTFLDLLVGASVLVGLVYYYLTATYGYWKDRGVPYPNPELIFGNIRKPILRQISPVDNHKCIYNQFKKERFVGYFVFRTPMFMIRDPNLIERILVKDFNYFMDHGLLSDPESEPLTMNLFLANGQKWRNLRYKLTPTFSSGKLKGMFDQICNCGEDLVRLLETYSSDKGEAVEVKKVISFFTTDVIATCAFGLELKAGNQEGKVFREMVSQVFAPTIKQLIQTRIRVLFPRLSKLFGFTILGKEISDYFFNLSKATVEYRKQKGVSRHDFIELLMNLRQQEENSSAEIVDTETTNKYSVINQHHYTSKDKMLISKEKLFSEECIAAQSFVFLFGGTETTSGALTFALYSIAKHPEIQRQVQEEVDRVISSKGWCYDAIKEMTYLDQVIQESLRMHPTPGFTLRVCTKPYQLPETNVTLPKGQHVLIPMAAIHMDPEYYPDPTVFNPERFRDNNYQPSPTYLPFGNGPRICIAMKFAVLEMKICLARILSVYSISVNDKTQEPIKYDPRFFISTAVGGIWLNIFKRTF